MKSLLKEVIINSLGIVALAAIAPGIKYGSSLSTLVLIAALLTVSNLILRPLINVLLFPINLITLGTFRWATGAIILYLTTLAVPQFTIGNFALGPFTILGLSVPLLLFSGIWAVIVASLLLSLITTVLGWIIKS